MKKQIKKSVSSPAVVAAPLAQVAVKSVVKQKETAQIFSRHPSHACLRGTIKVDMPTTIRFGSTTSSTAPIQINSADACAISSDKQAMKQRFFMSGVPTCPAQLSVGGFTYGDNTLVWRNLDNTSNSLKFPLVLKNRFGSRGMGNTLFHTLEEFRRYVSANPTKDWTQYIIEEYVNYGLEFRIHVSAQFGAFYSCRKALKSDVPEDAKWFRNDSNCVWFQETNEEMFKKPSNWEEICQAATRAAMAVGLDTSAIDMRVSAKPDAEGRHRFVIIECNSAPSFGDVTEAKYKEVLPRIIAAKQALITKK